MMSIEQELDPVSNLQTILLIVFLLIVNRFVADLSTHV